MEKCIEVIARYYYEKDYFVEVTHEQSVLAGRDYWLCKKNSIKKLFLFSSNLKNEQKEKEMIADHLIDGIRKYEHTVPVLVSA